jgi:hypothetical protein
MQCVAALRYAVQFGRLFLDHESADRLEVRFAAASLSFPFATPASREYSPVEDGGLFM